MGCVPWLRSKDPDLLVVKRSVRAAVVVPCVFALTHGLFSDPQVGLFGAFGAFALLLFVEFTGPPRVRIVSYGSLFVVGSCLVALGTVLSSDRVAAVVGMAVVGFVVLFTAIAAPQAAAATTAVLLTFVLPVSIAAPASAIGPRLLGWTIAAGACTAACLLVWPPPWHDELRRRLASAVAAVAALVEAWAEGQPDPGAEVALRAELARLRAQFSGTPYPPTGAASGAVALSKLVGRVEWVADNAIVLGQDHWTGGDERARAVTQQVASTLHETAALICDGDGHPVSDPARIEAVRHADKRLAELISTALDADVSSLVDDEAVERALADDAVSDAMVGDGALAAGKMARDAAGPPGPGASLDPGFHARALGYAAGIVADGALEAAGADGVIDRGIGPADRSTAHVFVHRLVSHLSPHSVWFRNAVRGAIGLTIAVAVVEVTAVQHGFWVVLGTLSVLRSNALGTGATALRAVGGTALGVVVGAAIMIAVGDHTVLLWVLLPLAVLLSGVAPTMVSFLGGQAAFTLVVVILFNIIQPVGWKVGLTRIEDVAIGCGVSVVVGFLFWPRGATTALGRALSNAFVAGSAYLSDAVDRLTMTSQHIDTAPSQQASHRAYLILDDAFRQFLAERGAKVVPLETISRLVSGSNRLRLAAFTLASLPVRGPEPGRSEVEAVAVAEAVLRDAYAASHRWYEEFAGLLSDQRDSLGAPLAHGEVLDHVLREALEDVRAQQRADRVQTTLQMLWADELLESQSQMQSDLLASADLFVRGRRRQVLV